MMNSKQSPAQNWAQTLFISLAAVVVFAALFTGLRAYEERVAVQAVRLAVEHRVDDIDYEQASTAPDIQALWAVYGPQPELSEAQYFSLAEPIVANHRSFLPLFIAALAGGLTFVLLGMVLNMNRRQTAFTQAISSKDQELQRSRQKLADIAIIDEQTGVYNRRHYTELLDIESRRAVREFAPLTVLLAEIDPLTGESTEASAEASAREIAELLKGSIYRPGDVVARLDERRFALLLPATNEQSPVLAERLCQQARDIEIEGQSLSLSIGLCTMQPSSQLTAECIGHYAETALQQAINLGGDQVCANTETANDIPVTYAE